MSNEKPDGWVAWREGAGMEIMYDHGRGNAALLPVYIQEIPGLQHIANGSSKKGWRIRPVKLVFLDEKEPSE